MKLYANMMIYNELPFLDHIFEQLLRFCDHVVAMDNGSTDGSREWLKCQRPRVTSLFNQQADPPNHAIMLNHMLRLIPNDAWVIKWDPDELPSDMMVQHLRNFLVVNGKRHQGWRVPVFNLMESRFTCMPLAFGYQQTRLFRKVSDTRFEGETHEHVTLKSGWGRISVDSGMAIVHFSYFSRDRLTRKADHYAEIPSSGFLHNWKALVDRLDLPTVPLPRHITYQASDEWLATIRKIK